MDNEYDFDEMLGSLESGGQNTPPSNFDIGSLDFGPGAFDISNFQTPSNYSFNQPINLNNFDWGSLDAGPGAVSLTPADQVNLNKLNGGEPPEKGFVDYAKEYGPYLMSPNPLAAILINKLSSAVGDYIGGKEGQLAQTGTSSLLSGATPSQALTNTVLSEFGNQTSQGISSLLPKDENPSLAQEYLNRVIPNIGAQFATSLLTGNTGALIPMIKSSLLGSAKNLTGNKVLTSLTGD